jgi:ADP-ribose pyrophosphatase
MFTIVIGDGLTNEFLSPEVRFQACQANVGRQEIDRLLGAGQDFESGVLPTFLRDVAMAGKSGANMGLLLLQNAENSPNSQQEGGLRHEGSSAAAAVPGGTDFIEPLQDLAGDAEVIRTSRQALPFPAFRQAVERLSGFDPAAEETNRGDLRFFLVGCHTEKRILGTATFLQNILGYENVAVCSHLLGSPTKGAHFAALRHNFPSAGISVFLDLKEAARFVGLDPARFDDFSHKPCVIDPAEAREALGEEQRTIIEFLCMHWTRTELRPLQGGFSGSLLFLADGWKGAARTEPMVLKVDYFPQMRREIEGYQQVFDFFGKHVPTFGDPVWVGDFIGVAMELAAMEGRPGTLQDSFELADGEAELQHFMGRLDKALELSTEKLYRNTRTVSRVAPYRRFYLHTNQQLQWLRENIDHIKSYCDPQASDSLQADSDNIANILKLIASNEDAIESEVCLGHGDLNLKNIICDEGDNIWFIDWTHSGQHPVEMDFAKLENDIKFVISNQFDLDDLPRLKKFEEYLLSHRMPADAGSLPDSLKFAKWDLRFRKILEAVRKVRETCYSLKSDEDWLLYRIALLKYALHTLSFDKRRDQGECDLPQLLHALYSIDNLVFILVADDFHLKIRGERPAPYPPRFRVLIDAAPWATECPDYTPPYYVDPSVLANDRSRTPDGWADPEESETTGDPGDQDTAEYRDASGRLLNPRGRTGIAGRGLLGRWGPNVMVCGIVTRAGGTTGGLEILLSRNAENGGLSLPKGFVAPDETPEAAVARVLENQIGCRPDPESGEVILEGYSYDARQTDHAWVELHARLFHQDDGCKPLQLRPGGIFEDVEWRPLAARTVNDLPSNLARPVREAVKQLRETARIERAQAMALLVKTG